MGPLNPGRQVKEPSLSATQLGNATQADTAVLPMVPLVKEPTGHAVQFPFPTIALNVSLGHGAQLLPPNPAWHANWELPVSTQPGRAIQALFAVCIRVPFVVLPNGQGLQL